MKTVCLKINVSSAKMNILFDGAITVKVVTISVMQRERGPRLFSWENMVTPSGGLCIYKGW